MSSRSNPSETELRYLYHEEEMSSQQIAEEFDVADCTAWRWLKRNDIETRTISEASQIRFDTPDELSDPEKLRALYEDDGLSTVEIGERVGRTARDVSRWLEIHDIEAEPPVSELQGPDHPNWQGGVDFDWATGREWRRFRQHILQRDGGRCRRCGVHSTKTEQMNVHHIRPVRDFSDPSDAHYRANAISLCEICHPVVEEWDEERQRRELLPDRQFM